jgi:hypothetical protein
MSVAITISTNSLFHHKIYDVAFKVLGRETYMQEFQEHYILFYADTDDDVGLHYRLSEYMVRLERPIIGHRLFVELHEWFNKNVEVTFDNGNELIWKYCPDGERRNLLRQLNRKH